MKKIICCILCILLLCGCAAPKAENGKMSVVTTIFPLYDFARAIGKDKVELKMLIRPGGEVHSYDPLPSDMAAVYDSDLFLYIGGESETWVDTIMDGGNINAFALIDCVEASDEGHSHEGHSHEGHHHPDEHIWTSPQNAVKMIESICESFVNSDPDNAEFYKKNRDEYIKKVNDASGKIESEVSQHEDPFMLVADRFPFLYFAEHYGIDYEAAFGGCAVSTDISLKTMARLSDVIEERNVKAVFCTEISNKSIANALSHELGVEVVELHSAHNVTLDDFNAGITYVDILYRNIDALQRGLC